MIMSSYFHRNLLSTMLSDKFIGFRKRQTIMYISIELFLNYPWPRNEMMLSFPSFSLRYTST